MDSATPRPQAKAVHLQRLEAESIHILREVVAEADKPVMLYSIGKDSSVMLRLAIKAFHPAPLPFPLLHIDTLWKFRDMYEFRDRTAKALGLELLVYANPEGARMNINPFVHGSALHTDIMKTQALRQALDKYGFDAAFGGARRDEEKSRAKERIPVVPLYFAKPRPIVERDGALIMVDDDRMPLGDHEAPVMRKVRFRTLGCYPLTGAIESDAETVAEIVEEMREARTSERQGRVIDHDATGSMEKKKQEGYF